MTTTTVFGDAADGWVSSSDGTYATCVAGGFLAADTSSVEYLVGQYPGFEILQSFAGFDTSGIPDADVVSSAVLSLFGQADDSTTDFVMEARIFDWGATLTTADFRTDAQLAACTLVASINSSAYAAAYMDLTSDAAFPGQINKTGFTRVVLCSAENRLASAPAANEILVPGSADNTGTTQDPKLVVVHAAVAAGRPQYRIQTNFQAVRRSKVR